MFVPGGLDLRRLLYFTRWAAAGSRARTVGAMVCCFAILLFVFGDLVVDTAIILAVRQVLWGRLIATMVLAETLNGLNAISAGGEFFQGTPIIVYMWLLERVRLRSPDSDWHSSYPRSVFSAFHPLCLHSDPGRVDEGSVQERGLHPVVRTLVASQIRGSVYWGA